MKIGVVGLGKVGLVLAQVLRHIGDHEVIGYDIRPYEEVLASLAEPLEPVPAGEITIAADMRTVVLGSDIVYICVATPNVDYDATSRTSIDSEDFDYTYLLDAVSAVSQEASKQQKHITLVVLSTVAPGTFAEGISDVVERQYVSLVYSPSFISLGTIERDLLRPKAILIGTENPRDAETVNNVWHFVKDAERIEVSIESAEIIKMASNAIQFFKIQYINALASLADKTFADIDEVSNGLERVLNHGWIPRAGMPDGGACRPRDVAALMEVSDKYQVSQLMQLAAGMSDSRKDQFEYMAYRIMRLTIRFPDLPVLILGDAYKSGVTYTDGSPGIYLFHSLLNIIGGKNLSLISSTLDPVDRKFHDKAIYVIAVPFQLQLSQFPDGSVVYDVWGMGEPDPNSEVTYISPGRTYGI